MMRQKSPETHESEMESTQSAPDKKIEQLEHALEEAEYRELRALADFDNYRKRMAAQLDEKQKEEKKKLIFDLLEVMDNFQRAVTNSSTEANQNFISGIKAVFRQMEDILKNHGLEKLDPMGEPFDPQYHEVLDMVNSKDQPPMTISKVYKTGYLFCGNLLRPAQVQVVKESA